jgi:uncharacterized protein YidB (DUF937 family)
MGLLDSLESMAANQMEQSSNPSAKIAGGLMSSLENHPGGLSGVMNTMQQNGVDPAATATGQPTTPDQIEQGLAGSGLIEQIAEHTGLPADEVKSGLATVLPIVMSHFTQGGTQAPPEGGFGGMAAVIIGKFL